MQKNLRSNMKKFLVGLMLALGFCSHSFANEVDLMSLGAEIVINNEGIFIDFAGQRHEINPNACYFDSECGHDFTIRAKFTWTCPHCTKENRFYHKICQNSECPTNKK